MADLFDNIKDSRNILEKVISFIPGFKGYFDREARRTADKMLRTTIADRYGEQLSRISTIQSQLIGSGGIEYVDDLQDAATRLQRFIDMVKTAAYGYAGFFDAIKVEEKELIKLYAFDAALLDTVAKVAAAVDNIETSVGGDGLPAAIRNLVSIMAECNTNYERRKEVLTNVQ
jgi:hypothetical protein